MESIKDSLLTKDLKTHGMIMMTKLWKIWKYALGSFSDDKTKEYDNHVVVVRTVIFVSYLVTNCFIISGVIRHWNNVPTERLPIQHKPIQKEYMYM